jgi:transcription antitermination factor NusG
MTTVAALAGHHPRERCLITPQRNGEPAAAYSPWRALIVQPQRELAVLSRMEYGRVDAYVPTVAGESTWSDRKKKTQRPLFSGYVFARFEQHDRAFVYSLSPWIVTGLEFGGELATITEQEIAHLRALVSSGLPLSQGKVLHAGDRVLVTRGPLKGVEGRLERVGDGVYVSISFTMLGRAVRAKVTPDQLRFA